MPAPNLLIDGRVSDPLRRRNEWRAGTMRLTISKTHSQQQLAVKLRIEPEPGPGILTWERKRLLIHAAKTALAAALCWWLALRFGWQDGYWGSISAIIVLQSNVGATVNASRERWVSRFRCLASCPGISFWRY